MPTWLPVLGFEGLYEVSHTGLVRSLDRTVTYTRPTDGREIKRFYKSKILKPGYNRGYPLVTLCDRDNKHHTRQVHDLVLSAFHRPKYPGEECRHLDGQRNNNHIDNLCWGTAADNMSDKIRHETYVRGSRVGNSKLKAKDIHEIRVRLEAGDTHADIAKDYKVSPATITAINTKRIWKWLETTH